MVDDCLHHGSVDDVDVPLFLEFVHIFVHSISEKISLSSLKDMEQLLTPISGMFVEEVSKFWGHFQLIS